MTDNQLNLLAAVFARSNMGLPMEDFSELVYACKTLGAAVERVCGEFMENDSDFDTFLEEAQGWKWMLQIEHQMQGYRISSPHVFAACGV